MGALYRPPFCCYTLEMSYKDPDAKREYMRKWRAKNPDKVRANDERDRNRQREYRREHLPQYAAYQRAARLRSPRENLVALARYRSKKKGILCTIAVADIEWVTHCPITGIELDYINTEPGERQNVSRDAFPTLDRKNPAIGYVPGNVFVLSHKANRMKQDASADILARLAQYAST